MSRIKILVLLTVFIDIIGLGIVIPVLPFYVQTFSGSPLIITLLFSVFALCSFISAPFMGALSDKFGRRPALIASITSTSIGWFIFAFAPSLTFLFLGRIVDGLAAGNLPVAQSALVDLAKDDKERSANLGLVGAIFGIGFILGPFIGGTLGHFGHSIPFLFVGILSAVNAILAYLFLPETNKIDLAVRKSMPYDTNPFSPVLRAFRNKSLRPNYLALLFFGLAISATQAIYSLYMQQVFGFEELAVGLIFTGTGIVIAINQGVMMRHFWLKHFKEPALELWMLMFFAVGYFVMSFPNIWLFALGAVMTTFGQSVLRVVMNGQVIAKAGVSARGEALGASYSIMSLSGGIAPFLAGALYTVYFRAPFYLGSIFLLIAFGIIFNARKTLTKEIPEDIPVISEV